MSQNNLSRTLTLSATISLVVGGVIGSGIFMKPAVMASQLGSPELLILVWIGAGFITLFGALTNAEISAMIPETGGQYVFFQKMYGDFFAFIYGWAAFAVFNTGGVASIAYVFSTYFEYFIQLPRFSQEIEHSLQLTIPFIGHIYPLENFGVKFLTILLISGLTAANYFSTKFGGTIQIVFTILKVGAMVLLVISAFLFGHGSFHNFTENSATIIPSGFALISAIIAATVGAFWAYDGWNNITFVSGEVQNPQKNIPKALLIGILTIIAVYVLINLAYLYILPIDKIAQSGLVASDVATVVLGTIGGGFIALLVIISTLGSTSANVLVVARVSFAMAQENRFFKSAGKVHPKFETPANSLLIHAVWTNLLVLSGSFDLLTDMLIFVSWFFYAMSAIGVFVLRKKMPNVERPYKVWGYPVVPIIFISFSAFFLAITLFNDISNYLNGTSPIINSLFGVFLTVIGLPFYLWFRRKG